MPLKLFGKLAKEQAAKAQPLIARPAPPAPPAPASAKPSASGKKLRKLQSENAALRKKLAASQGKARAMVKAAALANADLETRYAAEKPSFDHLHPSDRRKAEILHHEEWYRKNVTPEAKKEDCLKRWARKF
jgi:hypothetical protein